MVLAFFIFFLKIFRSFQTCWQGLQISQASDNVVEVLQVILWITVVHAHIQEYLSKGIARQFFYGDLVYEFRRIERAAKSISSGLKIMKPLRHRVWPGDHREDYRCCAWPFYNLVHIFPEELHLSYQGGWDYMYMTGLVQTSSEATWSWSSFPLIVSRDSFSLWTWARLQFRRRTAYSNGYH